MKRLALVWLALLALPLAAAPEYPTMGPDIYDTKADGNDLIAAALTRARASHRRVLVLFGANWCPWCRRLHQTLTGEIAVVKMIAANYELVLVDVNTRHGAKRNAHVNEKYGDPLQNGMPVFVVLDSDGKPLTTRETNTLSDEKGRSADRVLAFLQEWAPKR